MWVWDAWMELPGGGQRDCGRALLLCFETRWAVRSAESIWFTEKWHLSGYLQSFKRLHSASLALSKPWSPGTLVLRVYGAFLQGRGHLWLLHTHPWNLCFPVTSYHLVLRHCPSSSGCSLDRNLERWSVSQAGPAHAIPQESGTQMPMSVDLTSLPRESWRYMFLLHISAFHSFPGPPTHPTMYPSTQLSVHPSTHPPTHSSTSPFICPPIYHSSTHSPTFLSIYLPYPSIHLLIWLPTNSFIQSSI